MAVLSKEPVATLSLALNETLPVRNVECHGIDSIFMSFQSVKQFARLSVPNFARSVVAACDKPMLEKKQYLSPFLLKLQLVRGRTWPLSVLKSSKFWACFSEIFLMSSEITAKNTFNQLFEQRLFAFSDDGLLCGNFFDQLINLSPEWERYVLWRKVEKIDGLGLYFTIASNVLEENSRRVVTNQEFL